MTDDDINNMGFKLVGLITEDEELSQERNKPNFDDLKGFPEIVTIDNISNPVEYYKNNFGNTVASYKTINNIKVGLNETNYKELQEVSLALYNKINISQYADLDYIEKTIFDWLIEIYREKRSKNNLLSYIYDSIDNDKRTYLFYYRIESLSIQKPFKIGFTEITFLSEEFFNNEYELFKDQNPISREEFNDLYRDFKNKIVARIEINAVRSKAEKIAKKEITLSLNIIKCFLLHESLQPHIQMFDVDFNYQIPNISIFLSKTIEDNSLLNLNKQRDFGAAPVIINEKYLKRFQKIGLNKMSSYILNKKETEFCYHIENAILNFGNVVSTRNLYERIVKLISFFEGIIVPKENTKAKGQTYLKRNVIPKLNLADSKEIGRLITKFYDIRDKYLHNHIEIPIDLKELLEIQKLGLIFLISLTDLINEIEYLSELANYFNIKIKK